MTLEEAVAQMRALGAVSVEWHADGDIKCIVLGPVPIAPLPPVEEKTKRTAVEQWDEDQRRIRSIALKASGGFSRSPVE